MGHYTSDIRDIDFTFEIVRGKLHILPRFSRKYGQQPGRSVGLIPGRKLYVVRGPPVIRCSPPNTEWTVGSVEGRLVHVSRLELSIFPLEVFAYVAISRSASAKAEAELLIPPASPACPTGTAAHPRCPSREYSAEPTAAQATFLRLEIPQTRSWYS
jgi:hypothetical protein